MRRSLTPTVHAASGIRRADRADGRRARRADDGPTVGRPGFIPSGFIPSGFIPSGLIPSPVAPSPGARRDSRRPSSSLSHDP